MKKLYVGLFVLVLIAAVFILNNGFIPVQKDFTAIAAGEKIYRNQCMSCHGQAGKGEGSKVGSAINNQNFLSTVTNRDLFEYIKFGRKGTQMPDYGTLLADKDINHLVSFIRNWQTDKIDISAPRRISGDPEHGKKLYRLYCLSCHGSEGTGKFKMGTALSNPQYLQFTSNKQIWLATAYGREDTVMGPSLKGLDGVRQLKKADINDIVAYIRSLEKER